MQMNAYSGRRNDFFQPESFQVSTYMKKCCLHNFRFYSKMAEAKRYFFNDEMMVSYGEPGHITVYSTSNFTSREVSMYL